MAEEGLQLNELKGTSMTIHWHKEHKSARAAAVTRHRAKDDENENQQPRWRLRVGVATKISDGQKLYFIYPLIGKRYKCKDCLEQIGFDLCEDCYNSSSNLPGRFNQQHKPDHEFQVLEPQRIIFLSPEFFPGDAVDNSEASDSSPDQQDLEADVVAHPDSSLDQQDLEADVVAHGPTNDTTRDQEDIGPTS
ncbi:hypothetical protein Tco_0890055 [Tanacetum coccineum]